MTMNDDPLEALKVAKEQLSDVRTTLRSELPHLAAKEDRERDEMAELRKKIQKMDDVELRQEVSIAGRRRGCRARKCFCFL